LLSKPPLIRLALILRDLRFPPNLEAFVVVDVDGVDMGVVGMGVVGMGVVGMGVVDMELSKEVSFLTNNEPKPNFSNQFSPPFIFLCLLLYFLGIIY
jgi:hypothetical protein